LNIYNLPGSLSSCAFFKSYCS